MSAGDLLPGILYRKETPGKIPTPPRLRPREGAALASPLQESCRRALTSSSLVCFRVKRSSSTAVILPHRQRSSAPLHHGSLATRAPVVPLPRFAGAESGGALSTHRIAVRKIDWQMIERISLCASFYSLFPISFSLLVISSLKKLRGRSADRRHCLVSAPRRRALPLVGARGAGAPYGARSPTGAPPRFLHRRPNATAQPQAALPGTWLRNGRYPSPPVPVQRASRRPVIMPAGRLPRAARERVTKPPAGTALAPFQGSS